MNALALVTGFAVSIWLQFLWLLYMVKKLESQVQRMQMSAVLQHEQGDGWIDDAIEILHLRIAQQSQGGTHGRATDDVRSDNARAREGASGETANAQADGDPRAAEAHGARGEATAAE
jgi:hypothetical protein